MTGKIWKKRTVTVFLMIIIGLICFLIFGSTKVSADAHVQTNARKYFTSYVVKSGDSLWDIADTYMTTGYSCVDEYIGEVIKANRLESDVIYPGQLLILPYYSDRPLYHTKADDEPEEAGGSSFAGAYLSLE
ncbi:LysM repeat protein [Catenibacillus scindens]|uniref:LysM repeat protein n=1 Tax=Catenibacillus scindens TaxID=673271 RepID=A0A7W8H8P6_9FIRM|nr:LysM peptidoglycan-binding domain-containing protein [Catenibacillus scindens]MBB5263773.1 LysM repeat protein [Catenibacillus scindens]